MRELHCIMIGAPIDSGKRRQGCLMGPDANRTAGLAGALRRLHRPPWLIAFQFFWGGDQALSLGLVAGVGCHAAAHG